MDAAVTIALVVVCEANYNPSPNYVKMTHFVSKSPKFDEIQGISFEFERLTKP
jgi:hypothetical protein